MAVTASHVIVHRQVGIKNLEFPESFNLVEWIEAASLRGSQGLCFQGSLFSAYADCVRIVFDEALQIKTVTRQDAG